MSDDEQPPAPVPEPPPGEPAASPEPPPAAEALAGGPPETATPAAQVPSLPPAPVPPIRGAAARPDLAESREPLYREAGGFRMRLEPADLARLRELPGSRGRTDRELGEDFFEKQADRFAQSLAEDVTPPAEVRVVVDPYSRQAFLAIEKTIRSILSF